VSKHSETCKQITDELIKLIESGEPLPWRSLFRKPDRNSGAPLNILGQPPGRNVVSKKTYSGINFLILAMAAHRKGYAARWWGTFRQWEQIGAHVKKGEKATAIVFYQEKTVENEDGKEEDERFWKWYSVFNVDQVEGGIADALRVGSPEATLTKPDLDERFKQADEMIQATGAKIVHRERLKECFYSSSKDFIQLPSRERCEPESYYSVALHELVHWTGHKSRLNRPTLGVSKDSQEYAFEELIAEIGSAFTAARLGIPTVSRESTAHYLKHWLKAMSLDSHYIVDAAKAASRASGYLLKIAPPERKKTPTRKNTPAKRRPTRHEFAQ
jgi:antirestriction protein ArdC